MAEKIQIGAKEPLYKAAEKINGAIDEVNTFQTQIDQLVIEGDSSVEAAQARVDTDGVAHPTLKARADFEHNEVTAQLAQSEQAIEQVEKHIDTTERKSVIDTFHKMVSDSYEGKAKATYIMVGDSTRASNGAWIYKYVSEVLKKKNVNTHLSARSGLKAEHWSTYTPDLQPGFPIVDDIIPLIPGTGMYTVVDICLGINDGSKTATEIETYIKYGIDKILASKPDVLINLTSPNRYSDSSVVSKLITVYESLTETYGYGYINVLENVFKEWNTNIQADYFVDTTHPNELGQRRMAEYIISKLLPNYLVDTEINVVKTRGIASNYFVKVATVTLNKQYYGYAGTFIIQTIPGSSFRPTNAILSFAVTQSGALGTDAEKYATLKLLNFESTSKDFSSESFILRTSEMTAEKTVVDIYIKNISTGSRFYKLINLGDVNEDGVGINTNITFHNNASQTASLGAQSVGAVDAVAGYEKAIFLGSDDGSLWELKIDDTGTPITTKR